MISRVITGMPNAEYHGAGRITSTHLKNAPTPRAYASWLAEPRKVTAAMEFGTLCHDAVLEPSDFAARVTAFAGTIPEPEGDGRKTEVKAAREAALAYAAQNGLQVVGAKEYAAERDRLASARAVVEAVHGHEVADGYTLGEWLYVPTTHRELTVWLETTPAELFPDYDFDGFGDVPISLAARFDAYNEHTATAFELKTCTSAETRAFGTDFIKRGYDIQVAWYGAIAAAAQLDIAATWVGAAESAPPHEVQLFDVPDYVMQHGRERLPRRLHNILRANAGDRATLSRGVVPLEIPWIKR